MSYNLILNSSNLTGVNNNQFKYDFIGGSFTVPSNSEISISEITIPYSWYNITSALGNNTFSYNMPSGASTVNVNVTLPDGFYDIDSLNKHLQKSLILNKFYFYDPTGYGFSDIPEEKIIYPIKFRVNATNYTNTITFNYIPTSAPNVVLQFGANWLYANASTGFPSTAFLPTITIPHQNGIDISASTFGLGNIIGFTNGIYPYSVPLYYGLSQVNTTNTPDVINSVPLTINGNTLKTYTYNGSVSNLTILGANPAFPALATSVNGIIVRCNLVENNITMPSDVLDAFPINNTFGSNLTFQPSTDKVVKMKEGRFSSLIISFSDQDFNPLIANDPNVLISLLITFNKK